MLRGGKDGPGWEGAKKFQKGSHAPIISVPMNA